nr:MarR family transcriptional regulator [Fusibacter paucivorans]
MTQLNYLKYVDQLHETTISELSESLNLSKPTVTETIKKLQRCDLVHKRQCQADGRKYYIELTDKGEKLAHMEQLSVVRLAEKITLELDEEAVQKLIEALEGLK